MGDRPTVLLDIDGVVCDFLTPALEVASRLAGKVYTVDDLTSWDIWETIGRDHVDACYEAYRAPGFCAGLQPYPGAVEGIAALREHADILALTSPIHGPHWYYERIEWCVRHLGCRANDVIFTKHKERVRGDVLIDDRPEHVEAWQKEHPHGLGMLWNQSYNAAHEKRVRYARVRDWDDVIWLMPAVAGVAKAVVADRATTDLEHSV